MKQHCSSCLAALLLSLQTVLGADVVRWQCNYFTEESPLRGCRWNHTRVIWGEQNLASVPDPAGSPQNVLRVFYPNGSYPGRSSNKGGCVFRAQPFKPKGRVRLEYDIYFSENFDFVKGGKLPGLYGGSGLCAGGSQEKSCFSTRYMFRRHGMGEVYGYIPNESGDWFCRGRHVHCNFRWGHSFGRGIWRFRRGRWHTISQKVQLNTPNKNNGVIRVRVDGNLVYRLSGLKFREDYSIKVNTILFSTFFGGNTASWASRGNVYTYFKNFKVYY